jgi:hypothetical protein
MHAGDNKLLLCCRLTLIIRSFGLQCSITYYTNPIDPVKVGQVARFVNAEENYFLLKQEMLVHKYASYDIYHISLEVEKYPIADLCKAPQ